MKASLCSWFPKASSENSTSIGVREQDVEEAVRVLNEEFKNEIADGAMFPMHAEYGAATIAIVGENMKHAAGIAGKLFGTLGRSGISVIACAQGASETNISFVVKSDFLRKSLNVLHDSFFLSEYKVLNLFICGVGTVGGKLIEQIKNQYKELKERNKLKLNVVGIASSHNAIFDRDGLDLDNYREALKASEPSTNEILEGKDSEYEYLQQRIRGLYCKQGCGQSLPESYGAQREHHRSQQDSCFQRI